MILLYPHASAAVSGYHRVTAGYTVLEVVLPWPADGWNTIGCPGAMLARVYPLRVSVSALEGVMERRLGAEASGRGAAGQAGLGFLRVMLGLQVVLGLLWGISMLFFAPLIVLGDPSGPHVEKIAMEGGAHFALVLGAVLVWRAPRESRGVLVLMIFLNALWAVTDLVYIPLVHLTDPDFYAKAAVNAGLATGLFAAARRAGIL
jgi:hypothetical protein